MKKFNQTISVEVQVDSIAEMLLEKISDVFPNREEMAETVILMGMQSDCLDKVYNNLLGFTNYPENLEVGMTVNCTETYYGGMLMNPERIEGEPAKWESKYIPIGTCVITEINPIRKDNVQVTFLGFTRQGEQRANLQWVNHKSLQILEIS